MFREKAELKRCYEEAYLLVKTENLEHSIHRKKKHRTEDPNRTLIYLKFTNDPKKGKVYDPAKGIHIGRDIDKNEISIYDLTVSSRHCKIFLSSREVYLKDYHSSNGTMLYRGMRRYLVQDTMLLRTGDIIKVGGTKIRVRIFSFDTTCV